MSYHLPIDGEGSSAKDASQQMSSSAKFIMNNTEFAMMNQPAMEKARSGPGPTDPRLQNVTPDRTVGETTLSAFYNLNQAESSDLALKNQISGAVSSKLQYSESADDSLSRDTKGTAAINPFSNESYGDSFVLPPAMAGMSIPKQNMTQQTIQMQRSAQSAGKSDSWFSPNKPGGDSVSGIHEQALAQQSAQQNGSTVMFGDSYLKSPSTYYKNDRSLQSLQVTKNKHSDSILGQSILKNVDKVDSFDYTNAAGIIVERLKVIAREVAQYQRQNDKLGMDKSLMDYVQVANDEVQNLDILQSKEYESAKKILENSIQLIEECSTYYSEVNNIDLYQELVYDVYNNIARIENEKGDIEGSLSYLKLSLSQVKDWHKNPDKIQDIVQVTVIPELYMNICNAQIFLDQDEDALASATGAIHYSMFCEKLLEQRLKLEEVQYTDRTRFENILEQQIQISINGHKAKAQTYEGMKKLREAIFEYNQAKQIVEQKFGTNHSFFKELVNKISSINSQVKGLDYQVKTEDRSFKNKSSRPSTSGKDHTANPYFSEDLVDIRSENSQMGLDENEAFDKIANKSIMLEAQMSSIGKVPHNEDDDLMEDSSIFDQPVQSKQYQGNRGRKLKTKVRRVKKTNRMIAQEVRERSRSMRKFQYHTYDKPNYYGPNYGRHYTGGHYTRSHSSHSLPRWKAWSGGSRRSYNSRSPSQGRLSRQSLSRHSLNHDHPSYHSDFQTALHYRGHIMHKNGHQSTHMGHRCQHQCHYSLGHTHRIFGSTHQHCSTYSHQVTCQHHRREHLAREPSELSDATYSGFGGYHPRKCACCNDGLPMPIPKTLKDVVEPPPPEKKVVMKVKAPRAVVIKGDQAIKQRRKMIKQMQEQPDVQIDKGKKDYDPRVELVLQNQQAQQQNLLDALQKQGQRLKEEARLQMMEQERLRQEILLKRKQPTYVRQNQTFCGDYRCKNCNPPPEDDPELGPPVYDPHFKCWTYPYAGQQVEKPPSPPQQKTSPAKIEDSSPPQSKASPAQKRSSSPEKAQPAQEKKASKSPVKQPKKETKEMEVQADYVIPPKPECIPISTQTAVKEVSEIQIQTGPSTKTVEVQAAVQPPPRSLKYTPEEAARMLQRLYRRFVRVQRVQIFRQLPGVLYSRRSTISKNSGALEIMSMHMQATHVEKTCLFLRFTIFDYVTRKFVYSGTYDQLDHVQEFNVNSLRDLSYASLSAIGFEGPPFKTHIQTLQHIINEYREEEIEELDLELPEPPSEAEAYESYSSAYSEQEIPESPKTPPPIWIKPAQPLMISSWITTTEDFVPVEAKPPEPPVPLPVKVDEPAKAADPIPAAVKESKQPSAPPKKPKQRQRMTVMGAVLRIQLIIRWFLAWKDFRFRMMRSNTEMIHTHKMKAVSKKHGQRHYNVQVWRICNRHQDDPISNYRLIKKHSETRREHTEYTLLAQETNASHLHYNRSKRKELHKTQAQPEQAYQVSYSAPKAETVDYKKATKNPSYEKHYKVLAIPYNLVEDFESHVDDKAQLVRGNDPADSLYFAMLGWYMRKALCLQIEESDRARLNYIQFLEYVKIQQYPLYYKLELIQKSFQFLCPIRGAILQSAEPIPFPRTKHEDIGWHLRAEFALKRYQQQGQSCICQVYKRVRWFADKQGQVAVGLGGLRRKYKDWVLKLTLDSNGCKSSDHLFLAKLPVGLKRMAEFCQEAISVGFNPAFEGLNVVLVFRLTVGGARRSARVVRSEASAMVSRTKMTIGALIGTEQSVATQAKTSPKKADRQQKEREQFIMHLDKQVAKPGQRGHTIVVYSLKYYDALYEYKRYSREHLIDVFFQQTPPWEQEKGVDPRAPTASSVQSQEYEPHYATEVLRMLPKYTQPFMPYIHEELTKYRATKVQGKRSIYLQQFGNDADSSEDSEDLETDKVKHEEQWWAWDTMQLAAYQDDEFYNGKQQRGINTRSCFDLDNTAPDIFFDPEIDFWPSKEQEKKVAWHFMLANLKLTVTQGDEEPRVEKIHFETKDWRKFLTIDSVDTRTGIFMAQDIQREENENYACSIYKMPDQTFLAEAVNTRKPHCRAYLVIDSLAGMGAWQTFKYIDKNCRIIYPDKGEDEYMDEEDFVIQRVEFTETPQQFLMSLTQQSRTEQLVVKKSQAASKRVVGQASMRLSKEDMDKLRPIFKRLMRGCLARRRFKASLLNKKTQVIAKFQLTGELSQLFVFIQSQMTAFNQEIYKVIIFNMKNKVKRHDTQYLTLENLPGGFSRSSRASTEQLKSVFSQFLQIEWVANSNPRLIARAMVQQQVDIRTEQKSVEYQQEYRSSYEKSTRKSQKKRKRSKKSKKKKRASSDEDSYTQSESSDSSSSPDDEQIAIDQDIKLVKKFVKTLRKRVTANQNIREWYDTFDKDKSDRIEVIEFINMLARLQIQFGESDQERMQVMMFKLFDRNNDNFFRFADFEDIIFERIKPNYRKIVAYERQQWLLRQERGQTTNFAAMGGGMAGGMTGSMGGAAMARTSGGAMTSGAMGAAAGGAMGGGAGQISSSSQVLSGQPQQQQTVYQSFDTRIEKSAQNQFQTFEKYGISTAQQISSSTGDQVMPQGAVLQRQQRTMKFEAADQHQSAAQMAARAVELADQAEYQSFDTRIENSAQNQFKTFEKYGIATKPKSNDKK